MKIQTSHRGLRPFVRTLKPSQELVGAEELLKSGKIRSISREGETVTIYAESSEAASLVTVKEKPKFNLKEKALNFVRPEQLERDCAPEYVRWRSWNLAASVLSGVMGFMATSVFLDAQNASYSNSQAIALSGVLTGTLGKVSHMAASPLAKMGDSDPRNSYLRSQLVGTATSAAGLGLLGAVPGWHLPVFCATSITGTVGRTLGSAAGANIFSHMVPGPTKGDVTNKGGNQELLASLWGMPFGLGLAYAARAVGLPAGVLGAAVLGPMKAFCHFQAARSLRMEPIGTEALLESAERYLDSGRFPEAPERSGKELLAGLLKGTSRDQATLPEGVDFVSDLSEVVGNEAEALFQLFGDEQYLVSVKKGRVKVGLKKGTRSEVALKATLHAALLTRALKSDLPSALANQGKEKVELELVALTARAVPSQQALSAELSRSGWHLSNDNLTLPTVEARWDGKSDSTAEKAPPIKLDEFVRLLERQEPTQLKQLLG